MGISALDGHITALQRKILNGTDSEGQFTEQLVNLYFCINNIY